MSAPEITVRPARRPFVVGFAVRAALGGLLVGSLVLSVVLMFFFAATFHTLLGLGARILKQNTIGWGLPMILALLSSWSWMYLLHDRIGLLGNATLRARLLKKATEESESTLSETRHFVELRPLGKHAPIRADLGWLVVEPDTLTFYGDQQVVIFPRRACTGLVRTEGNGRGLLATWVQMLVFAEWRGVALLCRDTAERQSETKHDAERLVATLEAWAYASPSA